VFRLGFIIAVLTCAAAAGCATVVRPPANPGRAVAVYVLDHGRHPSLLIPRGEGRFVCYVYGDWKWYGMSSRRSGDAVAALLWPTRATLGRREIEAPDAAEAMRYVDFTQAVHQIHVEGDAVQRLLDRLDARFSAGARRARLTAEDGFDFVQDQSLYVWWHNCNHVMAGWLRELGCRTRGWALVSNWRVVGGKASSG